MPKQQKLLLGGVVAAVALVGCILFFSLRSGPNCGDDDVKGLITEKYAEEMIKSGIPDLVMAITQKRIKYSLDLITEKARNKESKNATCSARLAITFPQDDLTRASTGEGEVIAVLMRLKIPADPVYTTMIDYTVAPSADKSGGEGPIVNMRIRDSSSAAELETYVSAYSVLSNLAQDITDASRNSKPWDKDFKASVSTECTKRQRHDCSCKINHLEGVVTQDDFSRIGYSLQSYPLAIMKFKKYLELVKALDQQCPLQTAVKPSSPTQDLPPKTQGVQAPRVTETPGTNATSPAILSREVSVPEQTERLSAKRGNPEIIEASFDCAKAATSVEKLICSSPDAAKADKQLASAYSAATNRRPGDWQLRNEQRQWLKDVRNRCSDTACLVQVMNSRVQQLGAESK